MVEIAAAVVGVILAAVIGLKITGYRNLITYELTSTSLKVAIEDNEIVAFERSSAEWPTRMSTTSLKLINRGWKNISDVKLHAQGDFQPFSVERKASTISVETISIGKKGDSLEISIDFLPSKEEVTISFSLLGANPHLYKLTGAGTAYRVESIHYYNGSQQVISNVKHTIMLLSISILVGLGLGNIIKAAYPPDNTTIQNDQRPTPSSRP